jgi:hypothetical protein
VYKSSPRFCVASFLPTSIKVYVELTVGENEKAYLHQIFCKVKNRISKSNKSYNLDQEVHVCVVNGWYVK